MVTCKYYTGLDTFTKEPVYVAKGLRDRKMQRALMPPKEAVGSRRRWANDPDIPAR